MAVSKLIQDIGKCRDALETKDFKTVMRYLPVFERVCDSAKVQVDKFLKSEKHTLDFTYCDLQELSQETFDFVKKYQTKFTFKPSQKDLSKNEVIDNDVLAKFIQEQCDYMYLDRKLREAYKILNFLAVTVWLWTEAREQQDLNWQVTEAIRSFL